jgi:glutaredoxin
MPPTGAATANRPGAFSTANIPYQEFDIEKDAEARKAYEALGGGGIPFIDVNGTLIRKYDPDEILAALK